jgi:hypothetical protein
MDQIITNNNPELPKPQIETQNFEAEGHTVDTDRELPSTAAIAERLSSANNAVQAATNNTQTVTITEPVIPSAASSLQNNTSVTPVSGSLVAGEVDVIEKAWVRLAKAVVENTKNDPHLQSNKLSHVRRDYISKRFKKDIKLADD